jgi:hypothetical protein
LKSSDGGGKERERALPLDLAVPRYSLFSSLLKAISKPAWANAIAASIAMPFQNGVQRPDTSVT